MAKQKMITRNIIRILKSLSILGISFLIIGCAGSTPEKSQEFNHNNKSIVFVEGKPFLMPGETTYNRRFKSTDKEFMNRYRMRGVDCRVGDVIWSETSSFKESIEAKYSMVEDDTDLRKRIAANKVGCSRPLSNQEYDFYKQKESEKSARSIARMNYLRETAPRTVNYNVNHSGYIDTYRY